MAVWQDDWILLPRDCLKQIDKELALADCDYSKYWEKRKLKSDQFLKIALRYLKQRSGWSENILFFGEEDSNDLHACVENGVISEITVRFDLNNLSEKYTSEVISLSAEINCILLSENRIVDPDNENAFEVLKSHLINSEAQKYTSNPKNFLDDLDKKDK